MGWSTGFGIGDLGDAGDTAFMPLGLFAGGTVPGDRGPLADIGASVGFPGFLFGAAKDQPYTEVWAIGFTARGFLYL